MDYAVSAKCDVPDEWRSLVGRTFRHHKGRMYKLIGLAPHSETLEPMAVYFLMYGDFGLWVRPAKMFFEEIDVDGKKVRRFEPCESDELCESSTGGLSR